MMPPGASTRDVKVNKGKLSLPSRYLLFGPSGVGKTSLVASLPGVIVMPAEEGISALMDRGELAEDLAYFDRPRTWEDADAQVQWLLDNEHDHRMLVIDTVTTLEDLLVTYVTNKEFKGKRKDFSKFGGHEGASATMGYWRPFLAKLDLLREDKGMAIFMLGHSRPEKHKNVEGDDYDKIKVATVCKTVRDSTVQWCDAVLYLEIETVVSKDGLKARGYSTGKRVLKAEGSATLDAKSRLGLPVVLELGDNPRVARERFVEALKNAKTR